VIVAAYRFVFGLGTIANDRLPLTQSARVTSLADVLAILSERTMHGTGFPDTTRFFRPVASLTHSLDYAVWGLGLDGHHATNLALHVVASLLVASLYHRLVDESLPAGDAGGGGARSWRSCSLRSSACSRYSARTRAAGSFGSSTPSAPCGRPRCSSGASSRGGPWCWTACWAGTRRRRCSRGRALAGLGGDRGQVRGLPGAGPGRGVRSVGVRDGRTGDRCGCPRARRLGPPRVADRPADGVRRLLASPGVGL
jgi:hypothetical protein